MQTRRAADADLLKVVSLQDENLGTQLSPEQKEDGFLSTRFTVEQFAKFNAEDGAGIVVSLQTTSDLASAEEELLGFLVTSTPESNDAGTVAGEMIARFDRMHVDGQPLLSYKVLVGGPVCVSRAHRGTGVFEALYQAVYQVVSPSYQQLVVLISTGNRRSLRAHEKVGMRTIDSFPYKDREFLVLAKPLN